MGDILYYDNRRKRNEFIEGLKVDTSRRNDRTSQEDRPVSYIGDRKRFVNDNSQRRINNRRLRREAELWNSLPEEEKVWMQKRRIRDAKKGKIRGYQVKEEHKRYTGSKRAMTVAMTLGLTGALALGIFGVTKGYSNYANSQNQKQFEEIAQNRDALEQLGLSEETVNEIQSLQAELNSEEIENISDEEMKNLGDRVQDIQLYTMKSKLANSLGVPVDSIELSINYNDDVPTASVKVTRDDGTTIYNSDGILDFDNNISSEISDYIVNIGNTQTANSRLAEGTMNKNDAIEQYRSAINDTTNIATKEVSIDEKGNISLSQVSQQEIDSLIQGDDGEER